MGVSEVYPISLADIKPGSYIDTAAMPQADGTQLALEVLVFSEAARGSGEGHHPWDLRPDSSMTNATVADLAAAPSDRQRIHVHRPSDDALFFGRLQHGMPSRQELLQRRT